MINLLQKTKNIASFGLKSLQQGSQPSNTMLTDTVPADTMPPDTMSTDTVPTMPNAQTNLRPKFWERYSLDDLTHSEWEALCDGCGGCCLEKFLDVDDDPTDVEYTDVACKLLDCKTGFCSDYSNRKVFVPECITLTYDMLGDMMWLPSNCAYKRLYLDQGLPEWHLLLTEDVAVTKQAMQAAGVGVAGRCVSETQVNEADLEDRIVTWISA